MTAGDKGSIVFNGKSIELIPAVEVDCVDANGAGDVFRGAFGYGVMNDWNITKSTEYANLVAALQCTRIGNCSAIPHKNEIEEFRKIAVKKEFVHEHVSQILA